GRAHALSPGPPRARRSPHRLRNPGLDGGDRLRGDREAGKQLAERRDRRLHAGADRVAVEREGDRGARRGRPPRRRRARLTARRRQRTVAGGAQAAQLRGHGADRGQADDEEQRERGQADRELRGRRAAVAPAHFSALFTIAVSAVCTDGEVSTLSRMPANATAARVPTAYSAVFIPASGPRRLINLLIGRMNLPMTGLLSGWRFTSRRRARRRSPVRVRRARRRAESTARAAARRARRRVAWLPRPRPHAT